MQVKIGLTIKYFSSKLVTEIYMLDYGDMLFDICTLVFIMISGAAEWELIVMLMYSPTC